MNDLMKFKELVDKHDIAFHYSDDNLVWQRGSKERIEIQNLANAIGEEAQNYWNETIKKRFTKEVWHQFLWGGTK